MYQLLRQMPEMVAALGLLVGFVVGVIAGIDVIGALIGGTVGLVSAMWIDGQSGTGS